MSNVPIERKMCNQCHIQMARPSENQCSKCLPKMASRNDREYRHNRSLIFTEWISGIEVHCWLCGKVVESEPSADHVIPISQGGSNARSNLRLTHLSCNRKRR